jgi:shikimate dehydrogenase
MPRAALEYCGLEGSHELIDLSPEELRSGIEELIKKGFSGFNVTIPHKQTVFELCSEHTAEALCARACNTIGIVAGERLLAHNTDIGGFAQALAQAMPGRAASCCILGTGGAAKAAMLALAGVSPDRVTVVSRQLSKASALIAQMQPQFKPPSRLVALSYSDLAPESFDLIVNCSPIGQNGLPLPVWVEPVIDSLKADGLLFDMVYARRQEVTPLVELGRRHNRKAVDGSEMLIRQARLAFQFWTGESPPVAVFRAALEKGR